MTVKGRPQKVDWGKKPNYLLRVMHTYRKKNGLPIERELNDELAKRFPGYDAEQEIFIGHPGRSKATTAHEIDWDTKSNNTLRAMHSYRKKHGLPIEPELNAVLAKRFAGYDAVQKRFTGRWQHPKSNPALGIDWDVKSCENLRAMYTYRKKHCLPIEPGLNAALAKRFPKYDAAQKQFIETGGRPKTIPVQEIDWNAKSNHSLRATYGHRKKSGAPIEPGLNAALAKRFPRYDAVQKIFTKYVSHPKPKPAPVREINWDAKSDATLRAMFRYRKKNDLPIEPDLDRMLAIRFSGYDAMQKRFTGHPGRKISTSKQTADVSRGAELVCITNWANKSDNALRRAQKQHAKTGSAIDDALNTELAQRFPGEYDALTRTFIKKTKTYVYTSRMANATVSPVITPTEQQPALLSVKLKPVKQSLGLTYNNVYVNGKLILRNHANTELKLFGDGTLLGAYGIIKNNPDLPQRPIWVVYDTNLVVNKWAGNQKWARYIIYISNVSPTSNGVNLSLSDRRMILLETEKLKRQAGITRFEIQR